MTIPNISDIESDLMQRIRVDIFDRLLQGAFVIAILGVPASLSRAILTGWLPLYTLHLSLGATAIAVYLLREKLSISLKLVIVIGLFTSVGIGGLVQLGLLGVGIWWLVVTSLLISALYSPRLGFFAAVVTMLIVLAVAWCFVNNVLVVSVDANAYLTSWSSWLTLMVATSIMPFFVFQAIASLQSATHELLEEVSIQRDKIHELATHDQLTGLIMPQVLNDRLDSLMAINRRNGKRMALMFLDLDRFKLVNDTYGHEGGDFVLKELALRFRAIVREEDEVARIGGDEFIFLLGQAGTEMEIAEIAKRLTRASAEPIEYRGHRVSVGVSIGISLFPDHSHEAATLRRLADQAMYAVKKSGKNNFQFAVPDKKIRLASAQRTYLRPVSL